MPSEPSTKRPFDHLSDILLGLPKLQASAGYLKKTRMTPAVRAATERVDAALEEARLATAEAIELLDEPLTVAPEKRRRRAPGRVHFSEERTQ